MTSVTSPVTPDFPNGRTSTTGYTVGTETAYGGVGTMPAGLKLKTVTADQVETDYSYDAKGDLRQEVGTVEMD